MEINLEMFPFIKNCKNCSSSAAWQYKWIRNPFTLTPDSNVSSFNRAHSSNEMI
jgi:hypothetical protein